LHTRLAISNAFEATAFHSTNAFHFWLFLKLDLFICFAILNACFLLNASGPFGLQTTRW
jgi:hypothetical protein